MAASVLMVAAAPQQLQIPGCVVCPFTECFKNKQYQNIVFLTEAPKACGDVRTFKIDQPKGASAKLEANFTDSGTAKVAALAQITNKYKTALLVEVDYNDDGNKLGKDEDPIAWRANLPIPGPQFFKIEPNSVCSASLTGQHASSDITQVQAYMDEDA